jgi:hypothetical protein
MLELGGGIFLDNFEEIEPGKLIIVKKIVGNYTKDISEKVKGFKKITVNLEEGKEYKIKIGIEASEKFVAEGEKENLFFALDEALSGINKQITQ